MVDSPPQRSLYALTFGVVGLCGGFLTALLWHALDQSPGLALLVCTPIMSMLVGLAYARIRMLLPLLCIAGGVANGMLIAILCFKHEVAFGAMFGFASSLSFLAPLSYVAFLVGRTSSARPGSLLARAFYRSLAMVVFVCGAACIAGFHARYHACGLGVVGAAMYLCVLAVVPLLHVLDRARLTRLAIRVPSLFASEQPIGVHARSFVDVGRGPLHYAEGDSHVGMRGAPDLRTIVAGDPVEARRILRGVMIYDGAMFIVGFVLLALSISG